MTQEKDASQEVSLLKIEPKAQDAPYPSDFTVTLGLPEYFNILANDDKADFNHFNTRLRITRFLKDHAGDTGYYDVKYNGNNNTLTFDLKCEELVKLLSLGKMGGDSPVFVKHINQIVLEETEKSLQQTTDRYSKLARECSELAAKYSEQREKLSPNPQSTLSQVGRGSRHARPV